MVFRKNRYDGNPPRFIRLLCLLCLLPLVLGLVIQTPVRADDTCGTPAPDPAKDPGWPLLVYPYAHTYETATVKVFFHYLRRLDGTGGSPDGTAETLLSEMAGYFGNLGITFQLVGTDDYPWEYYDQVSTPLPCNILCWLDEHSDPGRIDIFITAADHPVWKMSASSIPSTAIMFSGWASRVGNQSIWLAHEMGHCLGLMHTHEHALGEDLPDGSTDCTVNGDWVCDTAPSPYTVNLHQRDDQTGDYMWVDVPGCTLSDLFHQAFPDYNPETWNMMSYAPYECVNAFSAEQRDRMFCAMENTTLLQDAVILPGIPMVEYVDKSAETLIQYSGQPRNAACLNFNNDDYKDLIITRYDGPAICYKGFGITTAGVVQFTDMTQSMFPSPPPAGTTGIITADFDNDGYIDFFAPNQSTGGRLYRNVGGDHFEDYTSASGLDNPLWSYPLADAFSAAWADYDADGILDLTLVSSSDDPTYSGGYVTLLHNTGNYFDAKVELPGPPNYEFGISPLWADFDNDGDLDLMVLHSVAEPLGSSYPHPYPNYFYINQGDGTFIEDAANRISDTSYNFFGRIAAVCDFDNDGDLDVVYAEEANIQILENNGSGYFGPGPWVQDLSFQRPTDLAVFDFDLDGYQDVLLGSGEVSSLSTPTDIYLFRNEPGDGSQRILVDVTGQSGLTGNDKFAGMAAADFNLDGFTDVYLSRVATSPFFYKAVTKDQAPQNNWVGLRLNSPYGANNRLGIGATVTLTSGAMTQAQVQDAGSGYASRHEDDLVFGLGANAGAVTAQIRWPTGRTQTVTGLALNQQNTVVDDSPVIDDASVGFSSVYHVNTGKVDWVFTWHTFNTSPTSRDTVTLDLSSVPYDCRPPAGVLTENTYGVTITLSDLGDNTFEHVLTYANLDCTAGCSIPYAVTSGVSDYVRTSEGHLFSIKSCLVSR